MSIFGFGSSQPKNVFVFQGRKERLTPKQFGYFSFQWSIDLSAGAIDQICKANHAIDDAAGPSLIGRFPKQQRHVQLELLALLAATYVTYAIATLRVPKRIVEEIGPGIVDGIASLQFEKGKVLPETQRKYIHHLIGEYCKSVMADFHAGNDPRALNANGSSSSRLFLAHIIPSYSENYDQPEKFSTVETTIILPHFIDDNWLGLMNALKSQGLTFHP